MKQEEFIQLFYSYRRKLCNFIYYKCGNTKLAEDLVQEVFLILWEKRETIKPDRIKSYLYTVANNLYIDQYRHEQLKLGLCHEYNYSKEVCSPEYLFELKEFDERLQHAIASLVEKERTVFLMNRVDGLTFNDIAENLDISVKAVEKRMHNAIEKLYKKLNHKL